MIIFSLLLLGASLLVANFSGEEFELNQGGEVQGGSLEGSVSLVINPSGEITENG